MSKTTFKISERVRITAMYLSRVEEAAVSPSWRKEMTEFKQTLMGIISQLSEGKAAQKVIKK